MRTSHKVQSGARLGDDRYWLSHCEGFRVDSPDGRVGIVEHVCVGADSSQPETLGVRTGLFVLRDLLIPIDEVEVVIPHEKRVVLRAAPRLGERSLEEDLFASLVRTSRPAARDGQARPRAAAGVR